MYLLKYVNSFKIELDTSEKDTNNIPIHETSDQLISKIYSSVKNSY